MSIAKRLPDVDPLFMQKCPFCGRENRIVVKGVYKKGDNHELYPDIGYSFCNCKAVFYTNYENVKVKTHAGFQHYEHPLEELRNTFEALPSGNVLKFNMPDPFFCEWENNPYTFEHWNPRFNHVLFDMLGFCEEAELVGFEVVSARREFNINSENPKTMEIILRKP